MKEYTKFYTTSGRVYYVKDKIKIEDRLGRPGKQRWGVYFMESNFIGSSVVDTWLADIGFPSLKKAQEYAEGATLRELRTKGRTAKDLKEKLAQVTTLLSCSGVDTGYDHTGQLIVYTGAYLWSDKTFHTTPEEMS